MGSESQTQPEATKLHHPSIHLSIHPFPHPPPSHPLSREEESLEVLPPPSPTLSLAHVPKPTFAGRAATTTALWQQRQLFHHHHQLAPLRRRRRRRRTLPIAWMLFQRGLGVWIRLANRVCCCCCCCCCWQRIECALPSSCTVVLSDSFSFPHLFCTYAATAATHPSIRPSISPPPPPCAKAGRVKGSSVKNRI